MDIWFVLQLSRHTGGYRLLPESNVAVTNLDLLHMLSNRSEGSIDRSRAPGKVGKSGLQWKNGSPDLNSHHPK